MASIPLWQIQPKLTQNRNRHKNKLRRKGPILEQLEAGNHSRNDLLKYNQTIISELSIEGDQKDLL